MSTGYPRRSLVPPLLALVALLALLAFDAGGALAAGGATPIVAASGTGKAQAPRKRGGGSVSPNALVQNGGLSVESIAYIGYDTGTGCRKIYGKVSGQVYGASSGDVAYLEAGGALMYNVYGDNYQAIQDTGHVPNTTFVDTGWQGNNQTYCSGTWYQAGHSYFSVSGWESYVNEDAQYSF